MPTKSLHSIVYLVTVLVSAANARAQAPVEVPAQESAVFKVLFDGSSLRDWQHSGNWKVVDGAVERIGKGGSLVYRGARVPDDFELRFEWKVASGSNSGVYYRPGQYEYQILDNQKHKDGKNPRTSAASLYFCMAPSVDVTRAVGTWNEARVVCKGSVIQHWLNGTKVVDFDYTDPKWSFNLELLGKRGANLSSRGEFLSLQDHGDPVWYRNIQMRSIGPGEDIGHSEVTPAEIPPAALVAEAKKADGIAARLKAAKAKSGK